MATRQTHIRELLTLAKRLGWAIDETGNGEPRITCPDGFRVQLHTTPSDVNAARAVRKQLDDHGFSAALDAMDKQAAKQRIRITQSDRTRNEARGAQVAERAEKERAQQEAVRRATASYLVEPQDVRIVDLLSPHPAPRIYLVSITPEMARAMLTRNLHNRPIRRGDVEQYKSAMLRGEFEPTNQGISFDTEAILIDGQQRLTAIDEANVSVMQFVFVGMASRTRRKVDTGRKRSLADTFYMRQEVQVYRLASVVRAYHTYSPGDTVWSAARVTNDMAEEILDAHPGIRDAVREADYVRRHCNSINVTAVAVGIYLLRQALGADHPTVNDFINGIAIGADLPRNDARLRFREIVINADKYKSGGRGVRKQLGLFLKAWLAYARGKPVPNLVFGDSEKMPSVFIPQPTIIDELQGK